MVTQTIGSRPKCTCLALMVCEEASILLGRILVQCSFLVWYFCYFRYIYIYIYIEASMQILRSCFSILPNLLCPDELLFCTCLPLCYADSRYFCSTIAECHTSGIGNIIVTSIIIVFELILTFIYLFILF